jgi:hypothetical protein
MFCTDSLEDVAVRLTLNLACIIPAQNIYGVSLGYLVAEFFDLNRFLCVTLCPSPYTSQNDCPQYQLRQSAHSATARLLHGIPTSLSLSTCSIWQTGLINFRRELCSFS